MNKKQQNVTGLHIALIIFFFPIAFAVSVIAIIRSTMLGSAKPLLFLTLPASFATGLFMGADRFTQSGENSDELFYECCDFDPLNPHK